MVIFLSEHEAFEPTEDDEFIYINRDEKKDEDDDMQMLTPILLDSMFDYSPPGVHQVIKQAKDIMDYPDDVTEATAETLSDLLLPSLDTPPRMMNAGSYDNDDESEISLDSYDRGQRLSPRGIISRGTISNKHHLNIPSDVRFEGEVFFSISSSARHINLKPRQSARSDSIFNVKPTLGNEPLFGEYSLADDISSYTFDNAFGDDKHGAEECKDDFEVRGNASNEEGFAYEIGSLYKEDDYWGVYSGHYGSRDFDEDSKLRTDYALDHESVRGISREPSILSSHYDDYGGSQEEPRSILEEMQDFFTAFLSCGVYSTQSQASPRSSLHFGIGYGPADFGVSLTEEM